MAIRSRTLSGGNCASATAAGASVNGATVAAANSVAPIIKHLDLITEPPSRPYAQSVSRMRGAASILLRDSELRHPILGTPLTHSRYDLGLQQPVTMLLAERGGAGLE